jgi:hypothetical protein
MTVAPTVENFTALPIVTGATSSALALMTEFTDTLRQVESFVNALVDTPFVPEAHWPLPVGVKPWEMPNKNPRMRHAKEENGDWQIRRQIACASATGAVLTGLPLGLDPLTALSQVFIVKGRPGLFTRIKVALAQARGHDVWDVERSDEVATVAGRRRGWPQERFVQITVTIEEAQRAGWTDNDTYTKTPADMLWNRATSRVLDRIASDVLFGIASIEDLEVEDVPTPDRPTVAAAVDAVMEAPRAGSDKLRSLLGPVRDVDEAQAAAKDAQPDPEPSPPIEQTDWRRLMARFNELGVNGLGRDVRRLKVMSHIIGRDIAKGSELSKADAQMILDNLVGPNAADILATALDPDPDSERRVGDQDSDPDEPAAATQGDVAAGADEHLADDVPEPAPGEGQPAALEGVADPWGDPS